MISTSVLKGSLIAGLTLLPLIVLPAHAADGPGWGPGHAMMWGGPTRNWFGWGTSEHFCGDEGKRNVTRFMALITRTIMPTEQQKPSEEALTQAFDKAQSDLQSLCDKPHSGSWTPIERLTVAESHLNAMIAAIHTIRGSLENFYNGLSDEQKKKMDGLKPDWRMRIPWGKD